MKWPWLSLGYEPCECCKRTDLDTGHGLCGFGWNCQPCLEVALTGEDTTEHRERHEWM